MKEVTDRSAGPSKYLSETGSKLGKFILLIEEGCVKAGQACKDL